MTKLYVGNLSSEVTTDDLQRIFGNKGFQVTSARVICDREGGRSRGFGFVEFASLDDAERAIDQLNGADMKGRALLVKEARPQEPRDGRAPSGEHSPRGHRATTMRGAK